MVSLPSLPAPCMWNALAEVRACLVARSSAAGDNAALPTPVAALLVGKPGDELDEADEIEGCQHLAEQADVPLSHHLA